MARWTASRARSISGQPLHAAVGEIAVGGIDAQRQGAGLKKLKSGRSW